MAVLVVLLLASVIFLTTVVLVAALMLRGQWEKMGGGAGVEDSRAPRARRRRAG